MSHRLDRPAWNALATAHAPFAMGDARARRYPPSIVPFAAVADNAPENLAALAGLPASGETMVLVEAGPITVPPGLEVVLASELVQMTADRPHPRIADPRIQPLGESDAEEMLALALLTKPGPFTLGAQQLGPFWGVRIDGRLVAMAGQRMQTTGFSELSGLCTHPEFQGGGLGTLLFRFVAGEIASRRQTAFLHAYASNVNAVRLYQHLGFSVRTLMNLRIVRRPA